MICLFLYEKLLVVWCNEILDLDICICVFYNISKHLEKYTTQPIQHNFVMMFGVNKYILALNNLKSTLLDSI
jgi:predicted membrane protein